MILYHVSFKAIERVFDKYLKYTGFEET